VQEVEDVHDLMMWSLEEELLIVRAPSAPVSNMGIGSIVAGARKMAFLAAVSSMVFAMVRLIRTPSGVGEVPQKFMV